MFIFFFQAEDGIRDRDVTGVQTCALPICSTGGGRGIRTREGLPPTRSPGVPLRPLGQATAAKSTRAGKAREWARLEQGRAAYGATGGLTGPPISCAVVSTIVPCAARGCSQSSSAWKSAAVTEEASQWSQMWWKT